MPQTDFNEFSLLYPDAASRRAHFEGEDKLRVDEFTLEELGLLELLVEELVLWEVLFSPFTVWVVPSSYVIKYEPSAFTVTFCTAGVAISQDASVKTPIASTKQIAISFFIFISLFYLNISAL